LAYYDTDIMIYHGLRLLIYRNGQGLQEYAPRIGTSQRRDETEEHKRSTRNLDSRTKAPALAELFGIDKGRIHPSPMRTGMKIGEETISIRSRGHGEKRVPH